MCNTMGQTESSRDDTGRWGEAVARRMLAAKGYRILGSRVKVSARDELDIVARDGDSLVFVEVKTRAKEDFARPLSAVDRRKMQVLSRAGVRYLKRKKFPAVNFRFDIVEVVGKRGDRQPVVRHIESAFPLDIRYILP
jgi:putative endonuclease